MRLRAKLTHRERNALQVLNSRRPEPVRSCDGCSACCEVVPVEELHKPSYRKCRFQTDLEPGGGCAVYGSRPFPCRVFRCAWLEGDFEDGERPDAVGFVTERAWVAEQKLGFGPIFRVFIAERWSKETYERFVALYADQGLMPLFDVQTPELLPNGRRRCFVTCSDRRRLQAYQAFEERRGRTFSATKENP